MDYKNILQKCINKICYITINRPKYLNALNNLTIKELSHALDSTSKNKTIRCVVILLRCVLSVRLMFFGKPNVVRVVLGACLNCV